jgi:hypothetical protein
MKGRLRAAYFSPQILSDTNRAVSSSMNRKGVSYDVGSVMGGNWRPTFALEIIYRELEIIKDDLHCNAVRISGLDINRLMNASEVASLKSLLTEEQIKKVKGGVIA